MRRTRIEDYKEVDKADDLERIVNDKRKNKRASKKKGTRRNRRYQNKLLSFLSRGFSSDSDE
ncbi:MAG: hypothetical protein L7S42_00310 [Flavobacteriaceae bacterium]|jgi:hypothetical protein|nr:hypothetical protein [Flavobacteriaceae bacterium]